MTRAAEQELLTKWRKGKIIGPADHITTIDDLDELEGFRAALAGAGRLTTDLMQSIQTRKAQIERRR